MSIRVLAALVNPLHDDSWGSSRAEMSARAHFFKNVNTFSKEMHTHLPEYRLRNLVGDDDISATSVLNFSQSTFDEVEAALKLWLGLKLRVKNDESGLAGVYIYKYDLAVSFTLRMMGRFPILTMEFNPVDLLS